MTNKLCIHVSGQHANDMNNVHLCRQCVETKLYMIEYRKSTRDDVWITLVLSVRKEDIKDHFR